MEDYFGLPNSDLAGLMYRMEHSDSRDTSGEQVHGSRVGSRHVLKNELSFFSTCYLLQVNCIFFSIYRLGL